jgi:hypothetical protein
VVEDVQFVGDRHASSDEFADGPDNVRRFEIAGAVVVPAHYQETRMMPCHKKHQVRSTSLLRIEYMK